LWCDITIDLTATAGVDVTVDLAATAAAVSHADLGEIAHSQPANGVAAATGASTGGALIAVDGTATGEVVDPSDAPRRQSVGGSFPAQDTVDAPENWEGAKKRVAHLLHKHRAKAHIEVKPEYLGDVPHYKNMRHPITSSKMSKMIEDEFRTMTAATFEFHPLKHFFEPRQGGGYVPKRENGQKMFDIDHVLPVRWGGPNHPRNFVMMHSAMNRAFGADLPEYEMAYIGMTNNCKNNQRVLCAEGTLCICAVMPSVGYAWRPTVASHTVSGRRVLVAVLLLSPLSPPPAAATPYIGQSRCMVATRPGRAVPFMDGKPWQGSRLSQSLSASRRSKSRTIAGFLLFFAPHSSSHPGPMPCGQTKPLVRMMSLAGKVAVCFCRRAISRASDGRHGRQQEFASSNHNESPGITASYAGDTHRKHSLLYANGFRPAQTRGSIQQLTAAHAFRWRCEVDHNALAVTLSAGPPSPTPPGQFISPLRCY
jgi:hypothetical protein